jgi:hypothetical protein
MDQADNAIGAKETDGLSLIKYPGRSRGGTELLSMNVLASVATHLMTKPSQVVRERQIGQFLPTRRQQIPKTIPTASLVMNLFIPVATART